MEYEELEVKAFNNLSGHIDGVYRDKNGKYWIIDYKTSSVRVIKSQKENPTLPYAKNKAQIMAYVALIERCYDIKIEGWSLLYIARDDPFTYKVVSGTVSDRIKERIIRKCKEYDDQYEVYKRLKDPKTATWSDMQKLIEGKQCKTFEFYSEHFSGFKGCPLAPVCFTKRLTPTVKRVFLDWKKS
jgi:ATP-dependent helicase/DNAse subunit B